VRACGLGPGARPGGGLVPGLQRGAARPRAGGGNGEGDGEVAADGVRSVHEALGIYTHDVSTCTDRRWGSVFWRSWARVIRGRLPVIGRPNADILHPTPAAGVRARPRGCWRGRGPGRGVAAEVHPGRRRARGTRGGRPVSGSRPGRPLVVPPPSAGCSGHWLGL
jgi:hypothetical protein